MSYYSGAGDCMYGRGDYYQGDYYQGDPFLGGIVKAISGVGKFIGGGVKALTSGKGSMASTPGISASTTVLPPPPTFTALQGTAVAPAPQDPSFYGIQTGNVRFGLQTGGGRSGISVPPSYPTNPQVGTMNPGVSITPSGAIVPCQLKGYHPNKSTYYRNGARIPKGSVCVKTRRINVANPRALRRAIRRAHGFAKLARRVLSYPISKPPKGRALFKKRRG